MKMAFSQKTLAREGSVSGAGLHTGRQATLVLKPAPVGTGIRFLKKGVPTDGLLEESRRSTAVGKGVARLQTVEHVAAALSGLEISNAFVDVDADEAPGLDGSSKEFVRLIKELGVAVQDAPAKPLEIREPLFVSEGTAALAVYPDEVFRVAYVLNYNWPGLENQIVDFRMTPEIFEREIAPARTFCTEEEAERLRGENVGRGATLENTVVYARDGKPKTTLRFPDECARHKVLDIIGDLGLVGFPIRGRVVGIRSGHALNRQLIREIKKRA